MNLNGGNPTRLVKQFKHAKAALQTIQDESGVENFTHIKKLYAETKGTNKALRYFKNHEKPINQE
jgi:hypothetical protein